MRIQFMLGEIANGVRRNASMIVSVILVSMISLFFLGSGLLAQREVSLAKGYWYDKVEVSIFMCTAQSTGVPSCADGKVTPTQQSQVKRDLESMRPLVQEIYYESADQAYKRFTTQFKNSPYLAQVSPAAMPSSYRVKLSDPKRYDDVVNAFSGAQGVEAVSDQHNVLNTFFSLLKVVSIGAVGLAVVMVICAILLITTTIRQVAFSRRRQVGIMRLVGASATVIYLPFVIETLLATLVGAALAIGLLWATVHYGIAKLFNGQSGNGDLISLIGVNDVWSITPWLLLGAFVLALVTSWITLRRYLKV
ncbi:permease-like cell division protein FtsX [Leekyejoonella antrihumi]|uniref:Cell division protein FtsX n=1 Tax=Leekyejoonella antrihumi TaxID=1660198 RepID=A0A563DZA0_9MICO|nr:permease-like cell division protein FtsX [Leekyejoonella antrihumi]TWP35292.1 ABC transporter permease [Leekyejoonella antrihumi]